MIVSGIGWLVFSSFGQVAFWRDGEIPYAHCQVSVVWLGYACRKGARMACCVFALGLILHSVLSLLGREVLFACLAFGYVAGTARIGFCRQRQCISVLESR